MSQNASSSDNYEKGQGVLNLKRKKMTGVAQQDVFSEADF